TQYHRVTPLRTFFRWLARENFVLYNPAADLVMPKVEQRLPRAVLTAEEAERVMAQPDVETPLGLRDRAILETFYATGISPAELMGLHVHDIDLQRQSVIVRQARARRIGCCRSASARRSGSAATSTRCGRRWRSSPTTGRCFSTTRACRLAAR